MINKKTLHQEAGEYIESNIDDLQLRFENPRHELMETEEEIIEYLLEDEKTFNLAKDILKLKSTSPLDVVGTIKGDKGQYIVVEGNRRVCALKLLNDLDKCPDKYRKRFEKICKNSPSIPNTVQHFNFKYLENADLWIERRHSGEINGIGTKSWNAIQKARYSEKSPHKLAIGLIDFAIKRKLISRDVKRITTITQYFNYQKVKDAFGIETILDDGDVRVRIELEDFEKMIKHFFNDLHERIVNSRSNKRDIEDYIDNLDDDKIISSNFVKPYLLSEIPTKKLQDGKGMPLIFPPRLKKVNKDKIKKSPHIISFLKELQENKLLDIYNSLIKLHLREHSALINIGAWSFFEVLARNLGCQEGHSFQNFFNSKVKNEWLHLKNKKKEINLSLTFISQNGNVTKHSEDYLSVTGEELYNHFRILEDLIIKSLIELKKLRQNSNQFTDKD